ncbi:unnamed protein product [Lota lota]
MQGFGRPVRRACGGFQGRSVTVFPRFGDVHTAARAAVSQTPASHAFQPCCPGQGVTGREGPVYSSPWLRDERPVSRRP